MNRNLGAVLASLIGDTRAEAATHWLVMAAGSPVARIEQLEGGQLPGYQLDSAGWMVVHFESGHALYLGGSESDCCANHYITCDDDLASFVGARLTGIDIAHIDAADDDWGGRHEQTFVKVDTTLGCLTFTSHNEHNGYYGGIDVKAVWAEPGETLVAAWQRQSGEEEDR